MAAEELEEFTDSERELAWVVVNRAKERAARERQELASEVASRACRAVNCGCTEPVDYLTRELESAHRCPNPVPRRSWE
jgi:hypothetical protein